MIDKQYRLTTRQVARFVADGLLVFPELIPGEINQAAIQELGDPEFRQKHPMPAGEPFYDVWPDTPGLGAMVRLPQVRGIVASLVGENPLYDHYAFHQVRGGHMYGQHWHADAIIDPRIHFDIQLFYFAHDTPRAMGGTMFLPGSHFRQVSESNIARHQNFVGQMPVVCKAGTLVVGHHGLWHCAQPNHTPNLRTMVKIRLNPTVKQVKLWNTDDLDDPAWRDELLKRHAWYGGDYQDEMVNRVKLMRYLLDDPAFDVQVKETVTVGA